MVGAVDVVDWMVRVAMRVTVGVAVTEREREGESKR